MYVFIHLHFTQGRAKKAFVVNSAINQDELSPVESPAVVVMDIALRDRDFARLQTAQDGSGLESLGSCKNCLFWGGLFPTHRLSIKTGLDDGLWG